MVKKLSLLALLLWLPGLVHAQWNEAWPTRAKITVNATGLAVIVDQAVVAVRLHSGNFSFIDAELDGSDLRFVAADDKTELNFHIEKFDSVNELAIIWVQLPKVDAADKTAHFWLYYGNAAASLVTDSKGTWDAGTVAVFHFAEKTLLQDASTNGLTATGDITVQKAALLGEAAVFNGKPVSITATPALKLNAGGSFTFSAWIKPGTLPQQAILYRQGALALTINEQKLELTSGKSVISGGEIKTAVWQHVAAALEAGKATLYVNGAAVGTGDLALEDTQAEVKVGTGYIGELDELELASVARGADWIKLAASGQGMDSQLLRVEEPAAGEEEGSTSYLGILFHSLTIDAWVIIIILGIMFIISTAVMYTKARIVSRAHRENHQFLKRFHEAKDDLLGLSESANFSHSSLFHLYKAGLREIRKRHADTNQISLSSASMDAIRASIDADLVRETHRLNEKMVLLTIAISGGPFLGLLGTVVGVMITFAAIAAAGDVNVNAIAPGIAAALLATVAGLAVAIPALFGYNYLASRIKTITAEMQIFVDEFVTRVAELYGR